MATQTTPYIPRNPGDLITSEDWDGMQVQIKEDIAKQVEAAKNDVLHGTTPADHAVNADKFDNKSPKNWTDELDQRYAPKVHDHEGMANYRHYFRHIDTSATSDKSFLFLLNHELGRFPLMNVYQLLPITIPASIVSHGNTNLSTKFLLFYGHEELDLLQGNLTKQRFPRRTLGIPWEQLLTEYEVQYTDDDSLGDVINDFLDAFFKLPASDEIDHDVSKWINDHSDSRTIEELKQKDEWDDIRWVMLPQGMVVGGSPLNDNNVAADPTAPQNALDAIHLNYNNLAIRYKVSNAPQTVDLMIVLRS